MDQTGRRGSFELIEQKLRGRLGSPGKVLDVGCGAGPFMLMLREYGWKPSGIDINPDAVEIARRRALDAQVATLADVVSPDGRFDAVVLLNSLEYFARPIEAIEQVAALLRPRGAVVIETPNALYHRKQAALGRLLKVKATSLMTVEPVQGRRLVAFGPLALRLALGRAGFEDVVLMPAVPRAAGGTAPRALRRSIFLGAGALHRLSGRRLELWPSLIAIGTLRDRDQATAPASAATSATTPAISSRVSFGEDGR
jgi:SAM-dependent methyltransferase